MKFLLTAIACFSVFNIFAQKSVGRYIKAVGSGCRIWENNYVSKDSVTWTGGCINKYADGQGTLIWKRDGKETGRYIGSLKNGKLNGVGKYILPDSYSLEGTFINGNIQGKGEINDGGDIMRGVFVNNILQGAGSITFESGRSLEGYFLDGHFVNLDESYVSSLKRNVKLPLNDNIYANNQDSNSLYYYILIPKGTINGVLVLLPSSGESAENVICCNKELIQLASNNHILSLILSINNAQIDDDNFSLKFLNQTFKEVIDKYSAPTNKFILGGLSGGGMLALRYTEISREDSNKTFVIPKAVIGIDPPVDIAGLYNTSKRFIAINDGRANLSAGRLNGLAEARSIVKVCNELYGGSPDQHPEQYIKRSSYSRLQRDGGNAKYLANTPVRLYCDPDILWQLKERNRDYYDMNSADLSSMINFLNLNGNNEAELIPALGKGYRLDGTRHPHSWSIVDPADCVSWMLKLLK